MCEVIFAFLAMTVVTGKECLFWNRDILMCSQVILGKSCLRSMRDRYEFYEIKLAHRCDLLRNRGNIFCISAMYMCYWNLFIIHSLVLNSLIFRILNRFSC